ncbi:MAG: phosphate ABC transporter permease PstA [Pirellulales bacterium]|nr:phosphate ABC transporter permease PstA [Pirellulales bacterium]
MASDNPTWRIAAPGDGPPSGLKFSPRWRRVPTNLLATIFLWTAAILVTGVLVWILADILWQGFSQLSFSFFVDPPEDAGRAGGIGSIIVSTLLILAVTLSVAGPLSLATAIALAETFRQASRLARIIRCSLDVLAAVPSIVFGLFGNAFFCIALGLGYSILSGGLTLACMVLPILIRTTEQAIAAVPSDYRYAAASLGMSRASTLFRVVLPAAAPSMAAGLVLGIGRALAETAALIFTSGYVTRMPGSLMDSGRAMSVHIYDLAMNVPGGGGQAYATASVLIVLLLIINATSARLMRLVGLSPQAGGSP